ncbi:hypothetical protein JHK85_013757 [Glycine max]|nr:hypothetical protein JHK85_013757 [Glycine max]
MMVASLFYLSLSLSLILTLSSAAHHKPPHSPSKPPANPAVTAASPAIEQACAATLFPQQCEASLSQSQNLPPNPTPLQLLQSAIALSSDNLATAQTMAKSLLDASADSRNRTVAAATCIEILANSHHRISLASDALPRGRTKDARAWLGAALAYQYDCWNSLKYANDTQMVGKTMSFIDNLEILSSNALSMAFSFDAFGNDIASWKPPATERVGFWGTVGSGGPGPAGGVPLNLTPDVTVCKNGGDGCYKTVQEAVNAAPDNGNRTKRFVIHIKEGVYQETVRVPLAKRNVVFLGDGIGKTVITGDANVGQQGMTTYNSATVGFVFQNCLINGTEEYMTLYHSKPQVHKNYLGRPWKEYSRTVFINSFLEVLVTPQGWMPWSGDFALKTLYYGEFESKGPGSYLSQRVPWSSKIPAEHVLTYSVQNFIQGNDWIPSIGSPSS